MKTSISVKIVILCPPVQRLFIYFYSLLNICMFRFVNNEAVSQHLPTGTRGLVWIYRQPLNLKLASEKGEKHVLATFFCSLRSLFLSPSCPMVISISCL